MTVVRLSKARLWPQTHRSGNVTWKVFIGKKNDGKADIRSFRTEAEAKAFCDDWNVKLVERSTAGLADLSTLARHQVLVALAKLEAFNATITEAVDFFIKYARPERGSISTEDAVEMFLKNKAQLKRREAYLHNCRKTFYEPFARAFPKRNIADISQSEAENYINKNGGWSSSTKASHIGYLRTFYQFFIKKGYAKLNPFKHVDKPQAVSTIPKLLYPEATSRLLQFALDSGRKAECATMTLVFFCGVRVEEAGRLTWDDIDLNRRIIQIGHSQAKMGHRRVNSIADNAYEWLSLCKSSGRVAPQNHVERLKRLRRKSGVSYRQNAMRHCFASYHIAKHRDAAETAVMLGHPNPTLLYSTYFELVTPEAADEYWSILPPSVKATREADARARQEAADQAAREMAEMQSNVGQAIKIDGKWVPYQDEDKAQPAWPSEVTE